MKGEPELFKLYFEKGVVEFFKGLPANLQALFLFQLELIQYFGITAGFPGYRTIDDQDNFNIKIAKEVHPDRQHNAVFVWGSVRKPSGARKPSIYFTAMSARIGSQESRSKPRQKFRRIFTSWIDAQRNKPFVKQACNTLSFTGIVNNHTTAWTVIKQRFYQKTRDIESVKNHHNMFGASLPGNPLICHTGNTKLVRFDSDHKLNGSIESLENTIRSLCEGTKDHFTIVNFIAEQDSLYHAQLYLLQAMTYAIYYNYNKAKINMVDVVIHDEEGWKFHPEELLKYLGQAPVPWDQKPRSFSMFLFSPVYPTKSRGNVSRLFSPLYKTLYLDLFEGCRDPSLSESERDKLFLKNRNLVMHEILAAVGSSISQMTITVKDLRGKPECDVSEVIDTLSRDSVVVRVNGGRNTLEVVKSACIVPMQTGYPYIVIVWADGNEDIVTVRSGFSFKIEVLLENHCGIRSAIESVYEFCVLNKIPGNQTVENLYSGHDLHIGGKSA